MFLHFFLSHTSLLSLGVVPSEGVDILCRPISVTVITGVYCESEQSRFFAWLQLYTDSIKLKDLDSSPPIHESNYCDGSRPH